MLKKKDQVSVDNINKINIVLSILNLENLLSNYVNSQKIDYSNNGISYINPKIIHFSKISLLLDIFQNHFVFISTDFRTYNIDWNKNAITFNYIIEQEVEYTAIIKSYETSDLYDLVQCMSKLSLDEQTNNINEPNPIYSSKLGERMENCFNNDDLPLLSSSSGFNEIIFEVFERNKYFYFILRNCKYLLKKNEKNFKIKEHKFINIRNSQIKNSKKNIENYLPSRYYYKTNADFVSSLFFNLLDFTKRKRKLSRKNNTGLRMQPTNFYYFGNVDGQIPSISGLKLLKNFRNLNNSVNRNNLKEVYTNKNKLNLPSLLNKTLEFLNFNKNRFYFFNNYYGLAYLFKVETHDNCRFIEKKNKSSLNLLLFSKKTIVHYVDQFESYPSRTLLNDKYSKSATRVKGYYNSILLKNNMRQGLKNLLNMYSKISLFFKSKFFKKDTFPRKIIDILHYRQKLYNYQKKKVLRNLIEPYAYLDFSFDNIEYFEIDLDELYYTNTILKEYSIPFLIENLTYIVTKQKYSSLYLVDNLTNNTEDNFKQDTYLCPIPPMLMKISYEDSINLNYFHFLKKEYNIKDHISLQIDKNVTGYSINLGKLKNVKPSKSCSIFQGLSHTNLASIILGRANEPLFSKINLNYFFNDRVNLIIKKKLKYVEKVPTNLSYLKAMSNLNIYVAKVNQLEKAEPILPYSLNNHNENKINTFMQKKWLDSIVSKRNCTINARLTVDLEFMINESCYLEKLLYVEKGIVTDFKNKIKGCFFFLFILRTYLFIKDDYQKFDLKQNQTGNYSFIKDINKKILIDKFIIIDIKNIFDQCSLFFFNRMCEAQPLDEFYEFLINDINYNYRRFSSGRTIHAGENFNGIFSKYVLTLNKLKRVKTNKYSREKIYFQFIHLLYFLIGLYNTERNNSYLVINKDKTFFNFTNAFIDSSTSYLCGYSAYLLENILLRINKEFVKDCSFHDAFTCNNNIDKGKICEIINNYFIFRELLLNSFYWLYSGISRRININNKNIISYYREKKFESKLLIYKKIKDKVTLNDNSETTKKTSDCYNNNFFDYIIYRKKILNESYYKANSKYLYHSRDKISLDNFEGFVKKYKDENDLKYLIKYNNKLKSKNLQKSVFKNNYRIHKPLSGLESRFDNRILKRDFIELVYLNNTNKRYYKLYSNTIEELYSIFDVVESYCKQIIMFIKFSMNSLLLTILNIISTANFSFLVLKSSYKFTYWHNVNKILNILIENNRIAIESKFQLKMAIELNRFLSDILTICQELKN